MEEYQLETLKQIAKDIEGGMYDLGRYSGQTSSSLKLAYDAVNGLIKTLEGEIEHKRGKS